MNLFKSKPTLRIFPLYTPFLIISKFQQVNKNQSLFAAFDSRVKKKRKTEEKKDRKNKREKNKTCWKKRRQKKTSSHTYQSNQETLFSFFPMFFFLSFFLEEVSTIPFLLNLDSPLNENKSALYLDTWNLKKERKCEVSQAKIMGEKECAIRE